MLIYLGLIAVVLIIIYLKWDTDDLKRRGIESMPNSYPLVGNMLEVILQKIHSKDMEIRAYYSHPNHKYIGLKSFNKSVIMIRDIELLKTISIKDFDHFLNHVDGIDEHADPLFGRILFVMRDQKWRDMRSTLSPAFTSSKMRTMFQLVVKISKQMVDFYEKSMSEPENKERGLVEVEMKDAFTRYTNDVIATCAFGLEVNSLEHKENEFYKMGKISSNMTGPVQFKFLMFFAIPKIMNFFNITIFTEKFRNFFRHIVLSTMKNREENKILRHDMIQLLMEARKGSLEYEENDKDNEAGFATVTESNVGKQTVKRKWDDDDIIAQAVLFLMAGFETTANLLCFIAHELTINPEIQKKLQEEIDTAIVNNNGNLHYNDLANLKYLDMVVSETLRLWPPVVSSDRQCSKQYKLASDGFNNGCTIEVGEMIWIPIYSIHRDPKYFENPEAFDPERFSDENKHKINPASYMPFGIGPRNCIGSRFALMETKSVLFYLLAKFDFVETAKTQNPIKLATNTFNLNSENGFWIGLKPRNL